MAQPLPEVEILRFTKKMVDNKIIEEAFRQEIIEPCLSENGTTLASQILSLTSDVDQLARDGPPYDDVAEHAKTLVAAFTKRNADRSKGDKASDEKLLELLAMMGDPKNSAAHVIERTQRHVDERAAKPYLYKKDTALNRISGFVDKDYNDVRAASRAEFIRKLKSHELVPEDFFHQTWVLFADELGEYAEAAIKIYHQLCDLQDLTMRRNTHNWAIAYLIDTINKGVSFVDTYGDIISDLQYFLGPPVEEVIHYNHKICQHHRQSANQLSSAPSGGGETDDFICTRPPFFAAKSISAVDGAGAIPSGGQSEYYIPVLTNESGQQAINVGEIQDGFHEIGDALKATMAKVSRLESERRRRQQTDYARNAYRLGYEDHKKKRDFDDRAEHMPSIPRRARSALGRNRNTTNKEKENTGDDNSGNKPIAPSIRGGSTNTSSTTGGNQNSGSQNNGDQSNKPKKALYERLPDGSYKKVSN